MLQLQSFTLIALLCALPALSANFATLLQRQDASSSSSAAETVISFFPYGEQDSSGSLTSSIPIPCDVGCYDVLGPYFFCFVLDTYPDGRQVQRSNCSNFICNQTLYDQTQQCLNCIIANGEERPSGYQTNTSLTAAPTRDSSVAGNLVNPNGLINITQANQILTNITEFCSGVSSSLTGESTVTASPTTTGPYETSWTKGQTVTLTGWTGLASYTSIPVETFRAPSTGVSGSSGAAQTSQAQASAGGSSAAAAASASNSSQSSGASRRLRILWFQL